MVYKLRLKNRGLKNAPKAACSWKYEICVIWSVWWSWAEWRDLATHPAVTNHLIPPSFYFCRRFFHRSDSNWKIGENLKNGRKRNMMRVYCRFEWLIIFWPKKQNATILWLTNRLGTSWLEFCYRLEFLSSFYGNITGDRHRKFYRMDRSFLPVTCKMVHSTENWSSKMRLILILVCFCFMEQLFHPWIGKP